jgi:hypothetical protein
MKLTSATLKQLIKEILKEQDVEYKDVPELKRTEDDPEVKACARALDSGRRFRKLCNT